MIRVAICDDERQVVEELSEKVKEYLTKTHVSFELFTFQRGSALLESSRQFDLIFLDIQMDGESGMETARRLRETGREAFIVFITVLSEYVYDAFEVQASDYLLKPVDEQRFWRTMERICRNLQEREKSSLIISSKGNTCRAVLLREIYYCEAVNHKMHIHRKNSVLECYMKMQELECRLDGRFFKCHRSYLVNLEYVCGYEEGLAILENGERVPVSRLRIQEFSKMMLQYMKERG